MSYEKDERHSDYFDERYWGCNPDPPVSHPRRDYGALVRRSLGLIVALLLLMALVSGASAQTAIISGGILCDTPENIKTSIETNQVNDQCGILEGQVVTVASVIEKFNYNGMTYTIAEYIIISPWKGKPVQYGIMGKPIREIAL